MSKKRGKPHNSYILGLDLGTNSVGWSMIEVDEKESPQSLINAGVRIFDAGMDGDLSSSKRESRNLKRRNARQLRRQIERRAMRRDIVKLVLQKGGFLPDKIDWQILDKNLITPRLESEKITASAKLAINEKWPYFLRAKALNEKLSAFELGRVMYHLTQRRGFLSNRKSQVSEDDGTVKKGIAELFGDMSESGARTIGEYFLTVPVHESRIRGHWTSRAMYEAEFDAIVTKQSTFHPTLTAEYVKKLKKKLFFQRKLKSVKHLVGRCSLEPNQYRCPQIRLEAQEFKILQQVNHLMIKLPENRESRLLTHEERQSLVLHLQTAREMSFSAAKKKLGFPTTSVFSIEVSEKKLKGNTVNATLDKAFGGTWNRLSKTEKDQIVEDLYSYEKEEALVRRLVQKWGLSEETAAELSGHQFPEGYTSLSLRAIQKLLPELKKGLPYMNAVQEVYGIKQEQTICDYLPRIADVFGDLRNPVVSRTLTELRKVVNGIVRQYGKPTRIRVELARDLKNGPSDLDKINKVQSENRKARELAKDYLISNGLASPSDSDIEKYRLWMECNHQCPYTGETINFGDLFGSSPRFDIEHIIPFSRSLDNAYANKTLCSLQENRSIKRNKTPKEAYTQSRLEEILDRVTKFGGGFREKKLKKFQLDVSDDAISDFSSQQLNDTRYASRLATEYLGALYGGKIDSESNRRIQVTKGQVTHWFRDAWNLNRIMDREEKNRDLHYHHAIDATVIALMKESAIQALSRSSAHGRWGGEADRHLFPHMELPFPTLQTELKAKLDEMFISFRARHRVQGRLHQETFYSVRESRDTAAVRKPVTALKETDLDKIIDPRARQVVKDHFLAHGDAKKWANPLEHPAYIDGNGNLRRIHRVRIAVKDNPIHLADHRYILNDENHHLEIFAEVDPDGKDKKWHGRVISRLEAARRKSRKEPVVNRTWDGFDFRFTLSINDLVLLDWNGSRILFKIAGLSQNSSGYIRLKIMEHFEARPFQEINITGRTPMVNGLLKMNAEKVMVTPNGNIRRVHE